MCGRELICLEEATVVALKARVQETVQQLKDVFGHISYVIVMGVSNHSGSIKMETSVFICLSLSTHC